MDLLTTYARHWDDPDPALRLAGLVADAALRWSGLSMGQQRELCAALRATADELIEVQPWRRRGLDSLIDHLEQCITGEEWGARVTVDPACVPQQLQEVLYSLRIPADEPPMMGMEAA